MYSLNGKEILARLQFSYNLRKIWCNSKYYNLYQNMTGDYYEQYQTPVPLNLRLCSKTNEKEYRKNDWTYSLHGNVSGMCTDTRIFPCKAEGK